MLVGSVRRGWDRGGRYWIDRPRWFKIYVKTTTATTETTRFESAQYAGRLCKWPSAKPLMFSCEQQQSSLRPYIRSTSLVAPAIIDPKAMVTHMYQLGVSAVSAVKRSNVDGFVAA